MTTPPCRGDQANLLHWPVHLSDAAMTVAAAAWALFMSRNELYFWRSQNVLKYDWLLLVKAVIHSAGQSRGLVLVFFVPSLLPLSAHVVLRTEYVVS